MSITIFSAPPVAGGTAKTAAGNASVSAFSGEEVTALSVDFASLLLAQLLPPAEVPSPVREKVVGTVTEPSDAPSLLAATGFIPVEHPAQEGVQTDTERTEKPALALSANWPSPEHRDGEKALPLTVTAEERPEFAGKAAKIAAPTGLPTEISISGATMETLVSETAAENRQNTSAPVITTVNVPHQQALTQTVAKEAIETPVHDRNWQEAFTQKIVWLANNDRQSAQITLNPPQMGPIEIALNIDKGNATASFVSASADVRESIEMALPRLREMFASIGLELGQASVRDESFRQPADNAHAQGATRWTDDQAILVSQTGMQGSGGGMFAQRSGSGLIDIFA